MAELKSKSSNQGTFNSAFEILKKIQKHFNNKIKFRSDTTITLTTGQQLETFRFEDEDDYKYEIWLKVFSRILKI